MSLCRCGNVRRAVGKNCLACEAASKRNRRSSQPAQVAAPQPELQTFKRKITKRCVLVTAAQNNTPVHAPFLLALEQAAESLDADILVIPFRYKNPTSRREADDALWWDESLAPYLCTERKYLNQNLVVAADVKIQPTASQPLSGFESLTGAESCIIGHPKLQRRTVPTPGGQLPKILTTTGVCTEKNYSDTKAGKLGEFHYSLGACLVELDGKRFHLREILGDELDGSFIDLDKRYTIDGIEKAPPALALVTGDTHQWFIDPQVEAATYGPGGMVDTLDAQTVVIHDGFDGYSVNPHHHGDPFIKRAKMLGQRGNVESELKSLVAFAKLHAAKRNVVLVDSNHGTFLARWIKDADWKHDPVNAPFYLETAARMLRGTKMTPHGTEYPDAFKMWVGEWCAGTRVRALSADDSFRVADIECGMHGHRGPNGARGSLKNLSRLGSKMITGHAHTPGIEEGHWQVGTSTPLKLEYTAGSPGSWLNSHVVVYANGKRAMLTVIQGQWRLNPTQSKRGTKL